MAYNTYLPGYQPGYQPVPMGGYPQPGQQVSPAAPGVQLPGGPASNGVIWVQGEAAARAYLVAPGSTVLLMDSDGNSFYLKSADNSGMPMPLRIFDYKERSTAPVTPPQAANIPLDDFITRSEFDALSARLDELAARPCKCGDKQEKKMKPKEDEKDA